MKRILATSFFAVLMLAVVLAFAEGSGPLPTLLASIAAVWVVSYLYTHWEYFDRPLHEHLAPVRPLTVEERRLMRVAAKKDEVDLIMFRRYRRNGDWISPEAHEEYREWRREFRALMHQNIDDGLSPFDGLPAQLQDEPHVHLRAEPDEDVWDRLRDRFADNVNVANGLPMLGVHDIHGNLRGFSHHD